MKKILIANSLLLLITWQMKAQVGVGTITPNTTAELHIDVGASTTRGFLVTGSSVVGALPDLGAGPRMMFYPGKSAFRAGYVSNTQWNDINTGYYSVAMGANTIASAFYSVAMGNNTTASGQYSVALGGNTNASGNFSTALGSLTNAGGLYSLAVGNSCSATGLSSVALGTNNNANANYATALGLNCTAGGLYSLADGNTCVASGQSTVAFGSGATASGDYSVAIGHSVNTNNQKGGFFLADSDPYNKGVRIVGSPDQMCMRFNGGYYFISNNNGPDIGVQVPAGGNSWSVASDIRLKENFLSIDGEDFLQKIARLNLTTWNYKGQDPKHFRHFGPMAQDFYARFGKDELGSIGCDTLINQQDLIGVNLVAVQALEKRTENLQAENNSLKRELAGLKNDMTEMREMLYKMNKDNK